jgi:hypothetical protein
MDRGASAAFLAELVKSRSQPFHLFELQLDGGTIYATDAARDIAYNGNTYPALSHFLEFSGIRESSELGVSNCAVALSGVDQTLISAVLNEDYVDRRLVIYLGFLTEAGAMVVNPIALFDGRCDEPVIVEDPDSGQCTVSIDAASHWVDFERRPGRHTNHEEQQIYFAGDTFFEFVSELSKPVIWGRPSPASGGGVGLDVGGTGAGRFGDDSSGDDPRTGTWGDD